MLNGNVLDGSAAFDAIAQEQSKKVTSSNKPVNSTYSINTSDGNIYGVLFGTSNTRENLQIDHSDIAF